MKTNVSTSAFIPLSVFTLHLNITRHATAATAGAYSTRLLPSLFLMKSSTLGFTWTPLTLTARILLIEYPRQLPLPNCSDRSFHMLSWKLTVYRSIVLTIMMYAMDSVLLTSPQTRKLDTVHYKSLRRIFKIKSSYYHRVLDPADAQCSNSNQYLASLAYSSRRVQSPSQLYSQQRLQLFGHIHRHPDSIENKSTYMNSHAYRHIRAPNRSGRPKLHWAESCMAQAAQRIDHLMSDQAPPHDHIHHEFFEVPSFQQVRHAHRASGIVWMDNTSLFRYVHPKCQDRTYWQKVVHKPRRDRGR